MENKDSLNVVNKLIVLFLIKSIDAPLTSMQLMKLVLENKFMNYFNFQQILDEVSQSNLVEAHTNGSSTFYIITDAGKQTLDFFQDRIPKGIVAYIENNINTIRSKIIKETSVHAEIVEENENEYVVVCRIQEGMFTLVDLKITVGTRTDAQYIINNWKNDPQTIYQEILQSLLKKRSV